MNLNNRVGKAMRFLGSRIPKSREWDFFAIFRTYGLSEFFFQSSLSYREGGVCKLWLECAYNSLKSIDISGSLSGYLILRGNLEITGMGSDNREKIPFP